MMLHDVYDVMHKYMYKQVTQVPSFRLAWGFLGKYPLEASWLNLSYK